MINDIEPLNQMNKKELMEQFEHYIYKYLKSQTRKELEEKYEGYFDFSINYPYVKKEAYIEMIMEEEMIYKWEYKEQELIEQIEFYKGVE